MIQISGKKDSLCQVYHFLYVQKSLVVKLTAISIQISSLIEVLLKKNKGKQVTIELVGWGVGDNDPVLPLDLETLKSIVWQNPEKFSFSFFLMIHVICIIILNSWMSFNTSNKLCFNLFNTRKSILFLYN